MDIDTKLARDLATNLVVLSSASARMLSSIGDPTCAKYIYRLWLSHLIENLNETLPAATALLADFDKRYPDAEVEQQNEQEDQDSIV